MMLSLALSFHFKLNPYAALFFPLKIWILWIFSTLHPIRRLLSILSAEISHREYFLSSFLFLNNGATSCFDKWFFEWIFYCFCMAAHKRFWCFNRIFDLLYLIIFSHKKSSFLPPCLLLKLQYIKDKRKQLHLHPVLSRGGWMGWTYLSIYMSTEYFFWLLSAKFRSKFNPITSVG